MRYRYPLVDGKIQASKVEINVVEHCNLACRACSHLSPVLSRHAVDPDELYRDLAILARHYHAPKLRLLGGEPLLHPDLMGVIEAGRRSGVADHVEVVTNGVLLPRMSRAFWQSVDRVKISAYPGKELAPDALRACRESADAHGVELVHSEISEFRQSYSEPGTKNMRLVRRIYRNCALAHVWQCHTVANGHFYKCPPSYFLPKLIDGLAEHADGVALDESPELGARLAAYLDMREPLSACTHCLGSAGRRFAHEQVRRAEFRPLQQQPSEELVDPHFLYRWPRLAALTAKLSAH